MPYTAESARAKANILKAALAASKVRLFKSSFAPNANSVLAEFVANECDYDGYVAGGVTVAAMSGPVNDPLGGSDLITPLILFTWALDAAATGNMVGGYFHTLAAGGVYSYQTYTNPVPMAAVGDSIPQVVTYVEGQNPVG